MKTRIVLLILLVLSLTPVTTSFSCSEKEDKEDKSAMGRIDTHIHLYDTEREGSVVFINPEDHEKIYFPHLPQEFINTAGPAGMAYAVVLEASKRREDNDWLVETVNGLDAILACIGNLDPRDPDYEGDLERLAKHDKFRGIRIRPVTSIDYADPEVVEAMGSLDERGLVLELGPNVGTADVVNIARQYPGMHIILNHLAGGRKKDGSVGPANWGDRLATLAAEPNIYCKVSMVYYLSGEDPAPTNVAFYRPMIDPVVDAFGPDRVMFGSNWTLSEMRGSYKEMIEMFDAYCAGRTDLSPEKFYTMNALKAYGLTLNQARE